MVKLAARQWSTRAAFSFCQVFSFFSFKISNFVHFYQFPKGFLYILAKNRRDNGHSAPFFQKVNPKIKKIAQFSNKIFVQFSQKYTTSALHRVKVLNFTALKHHSVKVLPPTNPSIWRRLLIV